MDYRPGAFLQPHNASPSAYLIILNAPIQNATVLQRLWTNSNFRICADGGANRLHDVSSSGRPAARRPRDDSASTLPAAAPPRALRSPLLPDRIHGDLDSLRADVRAFYAARAVPITQDQDKDSTDFGKVVGEVRLLAQSEARSYQDVLVLGSLAGRVDQGIGLLHEVLREGRRGGGGSGTWLRLWVFSEASCSFVLRKGRTRIGTAEEGVGNGADGEKVVRKGLFTPNVGILPIYGPATITTHGLEWDVRDWKTEMGGQVSTSNHVVDLAKGVEVETDHEVLFTIELADF